MPMAFCVWWILPGSNSLRRGGGGDEVCTLWSFRFVWLLMLGIISGGKNMQCTWAFLVLLHCLKLLSIPTLHHLPSTLQLHYLTTTWSAILGFFFLNWNMFNKAYNELSVLFKYSHDKNAQYKINPPSKAHCMPLWISLWLHYTLVEL